MSTPASEVPPAPTPPYGGRGVSVLRIPTTVRVAEGSEPLQLAAEVWRPDAAPKAALLCLPGGGMSRRYFDLQADDDSFSFARQMARRGFLVIALDHPGIGDSDRPADSYALTPELITRANAEASSELLRRVRAGSLLPGMPALPDLPSLGVGHSMGAMFTILQQAAQCQHAGIAVLGFSTRGLPEYVSPRIKELAAASVDAVRAEALPSARKMFGGIDYPEIKPNPQASRIFEGAAADPRGVAAIKAARAPLLPVPAFFSMIPGNVAPEAAQITVPVFLGIGERDMVGDPQQTPAAFTASPAVELYVQPGAGHSHFLFESRFALYDRLAAWVDGVLLQPR